jgi:predicted  nucleic acid-binding Zn-ribbon protein
MAITEESRHGLYEGLISTLGQQRATTLMELLPPVGWADVATKRDLDHLQAATKKDIENYQANIKKDVENYRAATKRDLEAHRLATKRDIEQLATDLRGEMDGLRGEIGGLRGEMDGLRGEMGGLRAETKRDLDQFRGETDKRFTQFEERMVAELKLVRTEMKAEVQASQVGVEQAMRHYFHTFLLAWLGSQATFAGMIFAAIKFA